MTDIISPTELRTAADVLERLATSDGYIYPAAISLSAQELRTEADIRQREYDEAIHLPGDDVPEAVSDYAFSEGVAEAAAAIRFLTIATKEVDE